MCFRKFLHFLWKNIDTTFIFHIMYFIMSQTKYIIFSIFVVLVLGKKNVMITNLQSVELQRLGLE